VGLDRVTIATVPRSGPPTELWQRFHRAVGLPDSIPLDPPEVPRLLAHLGATAPEALLVEAIVRDMEARGAPLRRRAARVRRLMQDVLLPRPERGDPLRLPARWAEEVADWARDDVRELDGLGVRVMGDLDDLLVNDVGVSGPLAPADQVATAAAAALILPERREPPKRPLVSRLSRVIGRRIRSVRRLAAS
jgi:hypothetical protein